MSIEKSIGWANITRNPIKGRCQGNCKLPDGRRYCYYSGERGLLNRFKHDDTIALDIKPLSNLPSQRTKIFLCSTHDLFGSWIPKEWRDAIFWHIKLWPQHIFQILTKFPKNIDREMPPNVWLGVSVTENRDISRVIELLRKKAAIKFVSIEPFLKPIYMSASKYIRCMNWIILGRLTGHGKKYDPPLAWIRNFEAFAQANNIPIFLKNNLKDIWKESLIQEMPK